MAISLPQSSGSIQPEYAATSITFNRLIYNIEGVLTPVFTANISYERKDFLVDAEGKRIGMIADSPNPSPTMNNPKVGNIFLNPEQIGALFTKLPEEGKVIGEIIADAADELIKADLIAKGIITA